jgi:hypothetical protein
MYNIGAPILLTSLYHGFQEPKYDQAELENY